MINYTEAKQTKVRKRNDPVQSVKEDINPSEDEETSLEIKAVMWKPDWPGAQHSG